MVVIRPRVMVPWVFRLRSAGTPHGILRPGIEPRYQQPSSGHRMERARSEHRAGQDLGEGWRVGEGIVDGVHAI